MIPNKYVYIYIYHITNNYIYFCSALLVQLAAGLRLEFTTASSLAGNQGACLWRDPLCQTVAPNSARRRQSHLYELAVGASKLIAKKPGRSTCKAAMGIPSLSQFGINRWSPYLSALRAGA